MKTLFVLTYYRPHWTGLTQYAARVAEGLAKRGLKIKVLCSQHEKSLAKREIINKVEVIRLNYWFKFLRSVVMPGFLMELIKEIRKTDSVVVYLPMQEVFLVVITAKIFGKDIFLVHNGDLVLPKSCGLICRLIESIYYQVSYWSIRLADSVLIQSDDYAQNSKLLKSLKNKWRVILPLFEIPKISLKEINNFKDRHGLQNKILIGYSGRFVEEKGIDYLLKAIPTVTKKYPNAIFVMAGDYQIKYEKFWEKIKDLIDKYKDNIKLLGLINDKKEMFAFYNSLDIYVQPSRTDCFPSSQIEAMLCGIPSICTDIPGARWPVKETGLGLIVKSKNENALAKGIILGLKTNLNMRKNVIKISSIFNYQKTLDNYERLFERSR